MYSLWNDSKLKKRCERIISEARLDGFTDDELISPYLDQFYHQTKSKKTLRMIRLAYYLGMLRAIRSIDDGKTLVSID